MRTWWKRWAERLSSSAVPIDGDPGGWRNPSGARSSRERRDRPGRSRRPGRLEASGGTNRRLAGGTLDRSVWRDLQLPPPAA